ncbi:hypothetical protein Hdeb2414_s0115g00801021 [Helianthus debilis subsp. tardiflorus]
METRNLEERCSGRGSHYGLQAHHLSYPLHQLTQETATGSKFYGMANGLFGKICDTFNVPFFNFLSRSFKAGSFGCVIFRIVLT